ncbi:hypothetical protein DL770_002471 [Monosporascus sp. CRB-9-2]|nr:hypothetical protein DL770_002471 [Monosporascus sp. CRB-9-2]
MWILAPVRPTVKRRGYPPGPVPHQEATAAAQTHPLRLAPQVHQMVTVPSSSQPPQPAAPADGLRGTGTAHLLAPGFALSHCEPADIPGLVDVYISGFQGGNYVYWRTPTPTMRAWNGERFARRFADPAKAQFKVVDEETGRLVPRSRRVAPGHGNGQEEEEGKKDQVITASEGQTEKKKRTGDEHPDVPEGMDVEFYREFFDGVTRAGEKRGASEKLAMATPSSPSAEQQPSHTNNDPGADKAQQ